MPNILKAGRFVLSLAVSIDTNTYYYYYFLNMQRLLNPFLGELALFFSSTTFSLAL